MRIPRVLFVCTYNGSRSRIAEEFTKQLSLGKIEAYSSSFESGKIGPLPIAVMKEIGIELPMTAPKSVFDRHRQKEIFDYVVTLCHETTKEQCSVFKANVDVCFAKNAERLSWSIPDFKSLSGTDEERTAEARKIREQIKREVLAFLSRIGIETGLA